MKKERNKGWALKGDTLRTSLKGQGIGLASKEVVQLLWKDQDRHKRSKLTSSKTKLE